MARAAAEAVLDAGNTPACGCAGAGTVRKWARGACARHRQTCAGVLRPGVVLWQTHRGELRRGNAGGGVPAPRMAYVPRRLAQKVKGVAGLLTELELDGGSDAEASTVMSGGGVAAALVEKEMQREPGRLDPSDRRAVLL